MERIEYIEKLLLATTEIEQRINALNKEMTEENTEIIDAISKKIEERQLIIDHLSASNSENNVPWTVAERELIGQLKVADQKLAPMLTTFLQGYSKEMQRLQQGKKAFQKYAKTTTPILSDGAFIDKRQ